MPAMTQPHSNVDLVNFEHWQKNILTIDTF